MFSILQLNHIVFSYNTTHTANISGSSGLIGRNIIITAQRVVTPTKEETFILRIWMNGQSWLFIESITMKNPTNNWERTIKWKSYDVNTTVVTGDLITEEVSIIILIIISMKIITADFFSLESKK